MLQKASILIRYTQFSESNEQYDNIPVDVSGDNVPDQIDSFDRDVIPDSLYQNIIRCQYKRPTPVQKYGLSIGIAGRDLMACAQTGKNRYYFCHLQVQVKQLVSYFLLLHPC